MKQPVCWIDSDFDKLVGELIKVLDESDAAPILNQVKGVYLILGEDDKRRLIELDFNQYDAIKRFLQLN